MVRSRLKKKIERKVITNLFLSVIGIVIIITLLIKFGIPLLVNFSLFLSNSSTNKESQVDDKSTFIPAPIFNIQNVATNTAQILIEGSALPKHTVLLYMNGGLADKVSADENGDFSSIVALSTENNIIKAKTIASDGNESNFSENLTIIFKTTSPTLEISSPSNNQSFTKDQNIIEVKGKTDRQVRVTVNGFWAIIDDDNNFLYNLSLKDGENEIKIVARDRAGNETEKSIKVNYSP